MMKNIRKSLSATLLLAMVIAISIPARPAQALTRDIIFPVIGPVSFHDDFGDPRSGHTHEGNDLLGVKMQPLVAAVDGTVRFVAWPQPNYGYYIAIEDAEGYRYNYLHVNNDRPGTDDGLGGGRNAYAPDVDDGYQVVKGQLIGWMGDSGNAESTPPHLHFEIRTPEGEAVSPYSSLIHATRVNQPTNYPPPPGESWPFGNFRGGAHLAFGQFEPGSSTEQLVTAAGPGGGPQVRIFRDDSSILTQFFAYPKEFRGGLDVAAGDVDGDGIDEIITAPGPGGGPQVKVFNIKGEQRIEFYAYSELFKKGISVAAADLDGDGKAEIITGSGPKMEPRVKVFNAAGEVLADFIPYVPQFQGGVDVAAIAATEFNPATIVTGPGRGGGPDVRTFSPAGELLASFYAFDKAFRGGVRVGVADVRKHGADTATPTPPEIFAVPASSGGAQVRIFSLNGALDYQQFVFEEWWSGGFDVAGADGELRVAAAAGGRRAAVVDVFASSRHRFFFNALSVQEQQRLMTQR